MKPRQSFKSVILCSLICLVLTVIYLQMLQSNNKSLNNTLRLYIAGKNVTTGFECTGALFQEKCNNAGTSHKLDKKVQKLHVYAETAKNLTVEKSCPGISFREQNNTDGSWHQVDKENKIYVVSAYYIKTEKKVFIIGAKPMYDVSVICQIWSKGNGNESVIMWETIAKLGSPNDPAGPLPYTAAIFHCPVNSSYTPTHVSLVTRSCEEARNILHVRIISELVPYQRRFTVCLAPIYSFGAAYQLVEWIELNKILGAEKFVLYIYSTAVNVDQIIDYYSKRGLAEVIPWRLPFPVTHHIHYFGQTVALNDCLFRNKQVSEYIVNIDKDEYIIPHSEDAFNWSQIIDKINKPADGYMFRNTFFRKEWISESMKLKRRPEVEKLRLITLKHLERENKIAQNTDRTKHITRTSNVYYVWIHTIPGAKTLVVPTTEGLLHHYRNWEQYTDKQKRVVDLTIPKKYEDVLINNVQNVWKELAKYDVKMDLSDF
ncbi:uncharacterized protein LOC123549519 [Mercenaria mercenaria]|uniref:uncharacterized protein LOC123549519 n=1 Tax=Mercenaria mercenaria TaxID=6596 RepID=UPI00234E3CC7|nr:uncharacterized protein LOC123549519 [Mercenaria mercenaria]